MPPVSSSNLHPYIKDVFRAEGYVSFSYPCDQSGWTAMVTADLDFGKAGASLGQVDPKLRLSDFKPLKARPFQPLGFKRQLAPPTYTKAL